MIKEIAKFQTIDGINIFVEEDFEVLEDYDPGGLDALYQIEQDHFWFKARNHAIADVFERYIPQDAEIIEIGAGTGAVSRHLIENNYEVAVADIHLRGLKYAQTYGITKCHKLDIYQMPFEDEFDAVCLFDVIEHLDNEAFALKNIHDSVKEQGRIVVTVPAHQWLWSRDDAIAGHKRRYTRKSLMESIESAGFETIECKYIFSLVTPLLALRRLVRPDSGADVDPKEIVRLSDQAGIKINPVVNFLLSKLCAVERLMQRALPLPFGGSLLLVAKKR